MCLFQGYEGERNTDPNSKKIVQAKLGLDGNANKKKKKMVDEGPRKAANHFHKMMFELDNGCTFRQKRQNVGSF